MCGFAAFMDGHKSLIGGGSEAGGGRWGQAVADIGGDGYVTGSDGIRIQSSG
jgi:hypothetical protein